MFQIKTLGLALVAAAGIVALVPNVWIRALVVWAACLTAVTRTDAAYLAFGMMLAWCVVYVVASRCDDVAWRTVRWGITVGALLIVTWMACQAVTIDPLRPLGEAWTLHAMGYGGKKLPGVPPPVQGPFGNAMDAALVLGLSLPAVAVTLPWALPVIGVMMLVYLKATAGAVCLMIVAGWLAWRRSRRAAWIGAALLSAFAIVHVTWIDPQGLGGRPATWLYAVVMIAAKPLTGWGLNVLGNTLYLVDPKINEHWGFLFNEYLQISVELGLPALLLVVIYMTTTFRVLKGRQWGELAPAVLALAITSAFSIPFRIGPTALLAALYLGRLHAVITASDVATASSVCTVYPTDKLKPGKEYKPNA